jgi:hypothetical protein
LTTLLVYHIVARGVRIDEVESTHEGDIDLRWFTGVDADVRRGYQNIRVTMRRRSSWRNYGVAVAACFRYNPRR